MIFPRVIVLLASGANFAIAASIPKEGNYSPGRAVERAAAAGTKTGEITAKPDPHIGEYLSQITIDGQPYNVLLDTGSNSLWIKGKGTGEKRWSLTYGADTHSTVSGTINTGTVTVAGITLTNQTYGLADTYPPSGYPDGWDGILGLGTSPTHLGSDNPSWLHNVMSELQEPIFAVDMIHDSDTSHYTFGYAEKEDEKSTPAVVPSDFRYSKWGLTVDKWGVPSGDVQNTGCIVDTGTTMNLVPVSVAEGYYKQVHGATSSDGGRHWSFPCESVLPDFTPTIHGYNFIVSGNNTKSGSETTGTCRGTLIGDESCILGQYFIQDQYIIFDYGKQQMDFAIRV